MNRINHEFCVSRKRIISQAYIYEISMLTQNKCTYKREKKLVIDVLKLMNKKET